MLTELASDLVGEQIDDRVEVLGLLLRSDYKVARLEGHLAALPVLVNRKDQMDFASALEEFREMGELALGIPAYRLGRFDVAEGHIDRRRRRRDAGAPARFARGLTAPLSAFGVLGI